MKRTVSAALVIVWALAALTALAFLFAILSGGGKTGLFNVNFGVFVNTAELKREEIPLDGTAELDITASYHDIEYTVTSGDRLIVTQYGPDNTLDEALFKTERSGNTLRVYIEKRSSVNIGINIVQYKLSVAVPRSWTGDLSVRTSSGGIKILDGLKLEDISLKSTSGSIKAEGSIQASTLSVSASSGSIKLPGDITLTGELQSSTTSGSQTFDGAVTASGIKADTSSGSVKLNGAVQCEGELLLKSSSGSVRAEGGGRAGSLHASSTSGSVTLGKFLSESYEIGCSSGSVRVGGISGAGELSTTSGSINATLIGPVGDVAARSSSGSITLKTPSELSFKFEGDTSSGSIRTDFELWYNSERKNHAEATVGSEPTASIRCRATSGSIKISRG